MADQSDITDTFYRDIPKIELHAHINASISDETITKLLKKKGLSQNYSSQLSFRKGQTTPLRDSFEKFKLIHKLSDDVESAYIVTKDVVREFASENVKYLELRSTPREVIHTGMSKSDYIESVLKAIQESQLEQDISVKLLLSIDRRNGVSVAMETVELAEKYKNSSNGVVIGIDLSGDPEVGDARVYAPALKDAKGRGLKLALHIAEVPSVPETMELLHVLPDRIGHGTCLHPEAGGSPEAVDFVVKHQIPLELCPTSNLVCQTVPSYADHHFKYWYDKGHPCVICTDGKGVFSTSVSNDYSVIASTFCLSNKDVSTLAYNAIDYGFCDENTKLMLKQNFIREMTKLDVDFSIN